MAKQIQNLVDAIETGDTARLRALSSRLTKRQTQDDELIRLVAYKERELNQAALAQQPLPPSMVPGIVQEWRAREDEDANWSLVVQHAH